MNEIAIVIDFDDTLISTTPKLKKEMFYLLKNIGISDKKIISTYKSTRSSFTIKKFATELGDDINKRKFIQKTLEKLFIKPKLYNYSGIENFLGNLNKQKYLLILVTFGDRQYQKTKIEQSELGRFFDKLIFTSIADNKKKILEGLKEKYSDNLLILDDSIDVLNVAKDLKIKFIPISKKIKNKPYYQHIMNRINKIFKQK